VDRIALQARLEGALPAYMIPSKLIELASFPLTPNAKIDRKALPAPRELGAPSLPVSEPAGSVEEAIAALWSEVLNEPIRDRERTFFELGGNSLLLVKVHKKLRETLAPAVPLTDLFRFPSVKSLAAYLDGHSQAERPIARGEIRKALLHRRSAARPEATVGG
jgi:hypothetical protein